MSLRFGRVFTMWQSYCDYLRKSSLMAFNQMDNYRARKGNRLSASFSSWLQNDVTSSEMYKCRRAYIKSAAKEQSQTCVTSKRQKYLKRHFKRRYVD